MPSVIIVDDESAARRGLIRLLQAHPDISVIGQAEDIPSALCALRQETPDAVLLDIEMPPGNGFDLISSLDPATRVIFVTAHAEHAPLAFEVAALDYLLKPVRAERLAQALDRLRHSCSNPLPGHAPPLAPRLGARDHLCLQHGGRTLIVPVERIAALRADGDFTRFHVEGLPSLLMSYNLGKYEAMLPDPPFARLGRSLIVNVKRVDSISSASRDNALLRLNGVEEPLDLRRLAAVRLKRLLAL